MTKRTKLTRAQRKIRAHLKARAAWAKRIKGQSWP